MLRKQKRSTKKFCFKNRKKKNKQTNNRKNSMKFHIQSKNAEFRPTKGDASPEKKQQQRDFFALFVFPYDCLFIVAGEKKVASKFGIGKCTTMGVTIGRALTTWYFGLGCIKWFVYFFLISSECHALPIILLDGSATKEKKIDAVAPVWR